MQHEILIVDDEPDIRLLIDGILRDEGYDTRQAADSDQALAAFRARRPALAILDVWLQGSKLDGIGILNAFHREEPQVPVVMISGHGTIEMAVQAIQQGAYDFIEKPFESDRLLLVVRRALEAAALARENAELRLRAATGNRADRLQCRRCRGARAGRPRGADRLARADPGTGRLRQGSRGPHDPCPVAAGRRTVRGAELRHAGAVALRGRAVRHRGRVRSGRASAPRRACWSGRMAARCCWTRSPTCRWRPRARSCACCRTRRSSGWADRTG